MKQRIPSIDEFINEQKTNEGITHIQVLSDEFGGYDDKEFLYKAWRMTLSELNDLLSTAVKDLAWCKKNSKGMFGQFTKRDGNFVKYRIAFIKQIIKAKNKNGEDYITDFYKDKTNEGQSLSFLQYDTYKSAPLTPADKKQIADETGKPMNEGFLTDFIVEGDPITIMDMKGTIGKILLTDSYGQIYRFNFISETGEEYVAMNIGDRFIISK